MMTSTAFPKYEHMATNVARFSTRTKHAGERSTQHVNAQHARHVGGRSTGGTTQDEAMPVTLLLAESAPSVAPPTPASVSMGLAAGEPVHPLQWESSRSIPADAFAAAARAASSRIARLQSQGGVLSRSSSAGSNSPLGLGCRESPPELLPRAGVLSREDTHGGFCTSKAEPDITWKCDGYALRYQSADPFVLSSTSQQRSPSPSLPSRLHQSPLHERSAGCCHSAQPLAGALTFEGRRDTVGWRLPSSELVREPCNLPTSWLESGGYGAQVNERRQTSSFPASSFPSSSFPTSSFPASSCERHCCRVDQSPSRRWRTSRIPASQWCTDCGELPPLSKAKFGREESSLCFAMEDLTSPQASAPCIPSESPIGECELVPLSVSELACDPSFDGTSVDSDMERQLERNTPPEQQGDEGSQEVGNGESRREELAPSSFQSSLAITDDRHEMTIEGQSLWGETEAALPEKAAGRNDKMEHSDFRLAVNRSADECGGVADTCSSEKEGGVEVAHCADDAREYGGSACQSSHRPSDILGDVESTGGTQEECQGGVRERYAPLSSDEEEVGVDNACESVEYATTSSGSEGGRYAEDAANCAFPPDQPDRVGVSSTSCGHVTCEANRSHLLDCSCVQQDAQGCGEEQQRRSQRGLFYGGELDEPFSPYVQESTVLLGISGSSPVPPGVLSDNWAPPQVDEGKPPLVSTSQLACDDGEVDVSLPSSPTLQVREIQWHSPWPDGKQPASRVVHGSASPSVQPAASTTPPVDIPEIQVPVPLHGSSTLSAYQEDEGTGSARRDSQEEADSSAVCSRGPDGKDDRNVSLLLDSLEETSSFEAQGSTVNGVWSPQGSTVNGVWSPRLSETSPERGGKAQLEPLSRNLLLPDVSPAFAYGTGSQPSGSSFPCLEAQDSQTLEEQLGELDGGELLEFFASSSPRETPSRCDDSPLASIHGSDNPSLMGLPKKAEQPERLESGKSSPRSRLASGSSWTDIVSEIRDFEAMRSPKDAASDGSQLLGGGFPLLFPQFNLGKNRRRVWMFDDEDVEKTESRHTSPKSSASAICLTSGGNDVDMDIMTAPLPISVMSDASAITENSIPASLPSLVKASNIQRRTISILSENPFRAESGRISVQFSAPRPSEAGSVASRMESEAGAAEGAEEKGKVQLIPSTAEKRGEAKRTEQGARKAKERGQKNGKVGKKERERMECAEKEGLQKLRTKQEKLVVRGRANQGKKMLSGEDKDESSSILSERSESQTTMASQSTTAVTSQRTSETESEGTLIIPIIAKGLKVSSDSCWEVDHASSEAARKHQNRPMGEWMKHTIGAFSRSVNEKGVHAAKAAAAKAAKVCKMVVTRKPSGLSLKELRIHMVIGQGAFGVVHLCTQRGQPKKLFALKSMDKQDLMRRNELEHVMCEKEALLALRHPFVVNLEHHFQDHMRVYFLMEFVSGGDLFSRLEVNRKLTARETRFYAAELLCALEFIHSKGFIYRDLKPENVMIDASGHVKLTDLGFARKLALGERSFTFVGTPDYLAPEIIQNTGHDKAVDFWALGVLIFELQMGYTPFHANSLAEQYSKILTGDVRFPPGTDFLLKDLLCRLLQPDPARRLGSLPGGDGARSVMKHSWFDSIDWTSLKTLRAVPPFIPPAYMYNKPKKYLNAVDVYQWQGGGKMGVAHGGGHATVNPLSNPTSLSMDQHRFFEAF
ncbi:hypothetical protein CBR_g6667 [Chara braunii]|uniref:Protein kinase domain-containing protein n=1 Tax=Chara braunii TaxID=69332 RepID=A0A388KKH5_CHABU|nr:hypothetical protein CBR_g6667 [Chara braunii]|eukprot:GBG70539.1 hypothetical protein CBR_g6667 [Chara braunii]